VRIGVSASVPEMSARGGVADPWVRMPGTNAELQVSAAPEADGYQYRIVSGLPVKDHRGCVTLVDNGHGGTEVVLTESFRARIWGTGGFLRARRERALVETARHWDHLVSVRRAPAPPASDAEATP
jgi:hypothetical protein